MSARSIAVVGGGFGGVGAAVMLRRAGYDDVTVFERGERVGGVWHHNTYPGAACDVPSHLYEFSFEPNPRWSRRYAPQAEIQAYLEDVARRHGVLDRIRTGTEVAARALGRASAASGSLETSGGHARGRRPAHRLRPALGPGRAADPGPRQLRGPGVPHRRSGATTSTSPASAWRWSAPAAARSRSCRRSSRSSSRSTSTSARPGWTFPKMDFAYKERTKRLFERFPVLQRLDRAAIFAFMELGAAGDDQAPLAAARRSARSAGGRSTRRSRTPSCAAR